MLNFYNIPILILCYNRYLCLLEMLQALDKAGYRNIWLLDNASTYPPLLKFYHENQSKYHIFRFSENYGHGLICADFLSPLREDYFVSSDPDIIPVEGCPAGFLKRFYQAMIRYDADKVGFGYKLDDLPDHFPKKEETIRVEKSLLCHPVEPDLFRAPIDTRFALNKPGFLGAYSDNAYRTGGVYLARHTSFYLDPNNLPDDEAYYVQNRAFSSTTHREIRNSFDILPPWVTPEMVRQLLKDDSVQII